MWKRSVAESGRENNKTGKEEKSASARLAACVVLGAGCVMRWCVVRWCVYHAGAHHPTLTYARVVVNQCKDSVASLLHVVIWTNAAEHGRIPNTGPGFVARLPANISCHHPSNLHPFTQTNSIQYAQVVTTRDLNEGCLWVLLSSKNLLNCHK